MNIVNGNPNVYFVYENLVDEDRLVMEIYPIIAFEIDEEFKYKIIALTLGEVEGTVFDCNLKCFIQSNGIRQTPKKYFQEYYDNEIEIFMSKESQEFIEVAQKEEKPLKVTTSDLPLEVTIVDKSGHNITSILGVDVQVSGGSLSIDD